MKVKGSHTGEGEREPHLADAAAAACDCLLHLAPLCRGGLWVDEHGREAGGARAAARGMAGGEWVPAAVFRGVGGEVGRGGACVCVCRSFVTPRETNNDLWVVALYILGAQIPCNVAAFE